METFANGKPRIGMKNRTTILLFINEMKKYPCIWDTKDVNYRNTRARQDAWFAIARRVGVNVPLLRKKWRSLSVFYTRLRKKWENMQAQGKGTLCERPSWFAYHEMEFLGNSKKTYCFRGKADKYLILGEETTSTSKECDEVDIVNPDEVEESYETTPESNYTEAPCEYTLTYDLNETMEENPPAALYYEKSNANDEMEEESDVPLDKRYRNEKRKSILLHELNEKLEKDLQQQIAKVQLQQMQIVSLEKKLQQSERKVVKLMNTPQDDYDNIMPDEEQHTKVVGVKKEPQITVSAIQTMQFQGVGEQCDPLYNGEDVMNHESSMETIRLMASSMKRMESIIGKFADKSNLRYNGFGEFMVRELNEMDETTSLRLINEITSMLKKEGQNYRTKRDSAKLS